MINLGGASFGSDHVVMLLQQVLRYGPSALVVYSGNNEFFNYDLELVNRNREWSGVGERRILVLEWLRFVFGGADDGDHPEARLRDQERLVADVMHSTLSALGADARPGWKDGERIQRVDRHHRAVTERFTRNLEDLRRLVAAAPAPRPLLLIAEVPANLLDPPMLALHDPGLGASDLDRWTGLMDRGETLMEEGSPGAAARVFREAAQLDPVHAMAHHRLGRALLAAGDRRGAARALSNALEMDMDPGRPVAAINGAVRDLAREGGVILVDLEPVFGVRENPAASTEMFHDACHLTQRGYDLLAGQVAAVLLENLPTK